jgi:hypothetical protein
VLTSTETLSRIVRILARLVAGEQPSGRDLAGAPLAHAWSMVAGADTYRIRAVIAMPPDIHERWRVVVLLAIDPAAGWALVLAGDQVAWWVLGDPLPGDESLDHEAGDIARRAATWASGKSREGSRQSAEASRNGDGSRDGRPPHCRPR